MRAEALPSAASLAKLKRFLTRNPPLPLPAAAADAHQQGGQAPPAARPRDAARPVLNKLWDLCARACTCADGEEDPPACPLRRGRGLVEPTEPANACPRGDGDEPCRVCVAFHAIGPDLRSAGDSSPDAKNARLRTLLGVCPAVHAIYEMALSGLEKGPGELLVLLPVLPLLRVIRHETDTYGVFVVFKARMAKTEDRPRARPLSSCACCFAPSPTE